MNPCTDLSLSAAANPRWARAGLRRLEEAGVGLAGLDPEAARRLVRVLGGSPAAASWLARDPGLLGALSPPELERELDRTAYLERLSAVRRAPDAEAFFRCLRLFRRRECLRLAAREILDLAPIETTAREVSRLAEAVVEAALGWAVAEITARHGPLGGEDGSPNPPCVLGMGKLGGSELNLSSDVDLMVLYRTARGSTPSGVGPRAFYAAVVSLLAEALGRPTPDGLVFRVDLDLRPEGRSGELAQPLENAVAYYEAWGQTWERGALLKARPVAGDLDLGGAFLGAVEPFVYRRSLDYTTVEDFREMKRRIDRNRSERPGAPEDLKLGRGGIREVEFLVQTLQLIHGGKAPGVRERGTLPALERLGAAGLLDPGTAHGLGRCYRFLRRVEHAVQAFHFVRTHRLPRDTEERGTLARLLGFPDAAGFAAALDAVRSEVHGAYEGLFRLGESPGGREGKADGARALLGLAASDAGARDALLQAGFRDPARALEALRLLRDGPGRGPSPRARRLLERVGPTLLSLAASTPDPDRALLHLGEFLSATGARAGYLALLEHNPATARLLVTLFGTSGFLSRYLTAHPELLDELVLGSASVAEKPGERLREELSTACARSADEEERLECLRHFRNAEFLRIALNDLWGTLDPLAVGRQIALVAEACLDAALRSSRERLAAKYGDAVGEGGAPLPFAILGLGKLGGGELDYYSDLDVLFLYAGAAPPGPAEGTAGLTPPEFFGRLAQRIIGALSLRTRGGLAFRVDARLRPSGRAGPLVTSLEAFREYHRRGAEPWEKQALTRLRPVAGDRLLGEAAAAVAHEVLFARRPEEDPRPEIARMRRRIEQERGEEGAGRMELKAGRGGLLDVEFAVQALQLLHGWRSPDLRTQSTLEALAALRQNRLLDDEETERLARGYAFLRRVEAKLRILEERPTDRLPAGPEPLRDLARSLGFSGEDAAGALLARVSETRAEVRRAYERIVDG